jgi:hypothetical protein
MSDTIKDGTGRGFLAEVDEDNHLHTATNQVSRLSFVSRDKSGAYSIYGRRNFAVDATDEGILFMEYLGSKRFYINDIIISATGTANKVEVFVGATYTSGGTEVTPINMNRAAPSVLAMTAYTGATDLVVTSGDLEVVDVRLATDTKTISFDGGLVLTYGKNLYFKGEVANHLTDKIRVMILGYEE